MNLKLAVSAQSKSKGPYRRFTEAEPVDSPSTSVAVVGSTKTAVRFLPPGACQGLALAAPAGGAFEAGATVPAAGAKAKEVAAAAAAGAGSKAGAIAGADDLTVTGTLAAASAASLSSSAIWRHRPCVKQYDWIIVRRVWTGTTRRISVRLGALPQRCRLRRRRRLGSAQLHCLLRQGVAWSQCQNNLKDASAGRYRE